MSFNKKFFATGGIVASSEAVCNTDSKYAFGADSSFTSNIATYQLDGNANDTTGNYNGTASNVTYTTGQFGNAASFNGSSSEITTNLDIPHTSDFSVSFWVKIDTFGNDVICTDGDFDTNAELGFGFQAVTTGSKIIFYVASGSNLFNAQVSSLSTGTWYHVVGVCDLTKNIKLYINGNLEQTTNYTSASRNDRSTFRIGSDHSAGGRFFPGDLDQIRIFDRPITASEVATLYAETSATASSINPLNEGQGVALYNLDYDASDAGGLYDGTPIGGTNFGVGGKINYGVKFDGISGQGITFTNPIPLTNTDFNVSFWLKFDTVPSGTATNFAGTIFGNDNANYGAFQIYYYYRATGVTMMLQRTVGSTVYYDTSYNNAIGINVTNDTWHHISVNYTASTYNAAFYLDGSSAGSATLNGSVSITNSTTTTIASGYGSSPYFNGYIDQVRIFDGVLQTDKIELLSAEEACVYTATTTDNDYPTTNVAYYKLDNSADDSVSTNDGTETDIEYRFGRYGQAAVFNGSSSYIETPSIIPTNDYSLSCWVNFDSLAGSGSYQLIYEAYKNTFWYLALYDGGKIATFNGTSTFNTTSDVISTGQWYHIVYTSSSTNGKNIYLNGNSTPVATTSDTTGNSNISGSWEGFGKYHNNTLYLDGKIDQVRIFSTALDSDQVSQLYNEKPETDTSNFKTVLYTGDGGSQYISNVGMDLETNGGLVWLKSRDVASSHTLHDSVRGYDTDGTGGANSYKPLHSDATTAETAFNSTWHNNFGFLNSLEANGFTVVNGTGSTSDNYNKNNEDYVAWVWKGGGDAVSTNNNGNAQITADVSANTEAGFSIVKYTVTNNLNKTVYHGLDEAPEIVITKRTDLSEDWFIFTSVIPGQDHHYLIFDTDAASTSAITAPTDNYIHSRQNGTIINYCFHSVSGYSKIGTYPGSGSSQTIYVTEDDTSTGNGGFEPSFVMIKNIDSNSTNWMIYDAVRDADGTINEYLEANTSDAKANASNATITPISNGFTIGATASGHINDSSDTYLYMAFK